MKIVILIISIFFVLQSNVRAEIKNKKYFKFLGELKNQVIYDENNKAIEYDYISLDQKIDLFLESEDEYIENINKVQLNYLDKKIKISYNKKVELICKDIYSADSIFHYTEAICIVHSIKYKN
ncbi:hypothetical protein OC498_13620 [Acinetobacter bohemicus]|uniref:hypothetical protein n=1 Tax=Acinetobacter TaxID=469 RepID=UPI001197B4E7|nr:MULTISPECIES: hypothetical protein [Acinetobacter]MCO8043654.1 hypothetical protein [Acinetobacter sp. S4400-12]MCU7225916.1 hypothetical protein [Acinetobacter bohemicus]TSH68321.1 hypothetical protein E2K73_13760 [Acinetobacter sp. RF15A]TSI16276.1 hypothetical protein E2K74_10850 [Acinetobacter sp. RF15B]